MRVLPPGVRIDDGDIIAEFSGGEPYAHHIDLSTTGPYDGKPLP